MPVDTTKPRVSILLPQSHSEINLDAQIAAQLTPLNNNDTSTADAAINVISPIVVDHINDNSPSQDSESDFDVPIMSLLSMMAESDEDIKFAQKGYKKLNKICDTLQGELFKGKISK